MQRKNVGQVKPDVNKELSYRKAAPLYSVQKHYGMTNGADGFTLIELLVVVLIIGILAAVAVPQYQKAVDRTKIITLASVGEDIVKAQELHYLANGTYADSMDQLAISVNSYTFSLNVDRRLYLGGGSYLPDILLIFGYTYSNYTNVRNCHALKTNTRAVNACKHLCKNANPTNDGAWKSCDFKLK